MMLIRGIILCLSFVVLFYSKPHCQSVKVDGDLTITQSGNDNPEQGTIRWTGNDFEGWNGTEWLSLTAGNMIRDVDGNYYRTIRIGAQLWMTDNLRVTKYNDGTDIPLGNDQATWASLNSMLTPAYTWYNDDSTGYAIPYGALYNFYAVDTLSNGGKNICPQGWHVPSDAEWVQLTTTLGGESIAGGKMKERALWTSPNTGADNSAGFFALPAGRRGPNGTFAGLLTNGYWRSTTPDENNGVQAYYRPLSNLSASCTRSTWNKGIGFSVRCLKD